jgi:hypothetical protein
MLCICFNVPLPCALAAGNSNFSTKSVVLAALTDSALIPHYPRLHDPGLPIAGGYGCSLRLLFISPPDRGRKYRINYGN